MSSESIIPDPAKPWEEIAELLKTGTADELHDYVADLPDEDVALTLSRLSEVQQATMLTSLKPEAAADVMEHLTDAQAVDLIETLPPATAAAILDEMPSAEQADLIGDLDDEEAETILTFMQPDEAEDARALIRYAPDVAGGLMVTEFLSYDEHLTVAKVIEDLRKRADEYRDYNVQYAYARDAQGRLTGVLRLRDLLLADNSTLISRMMIPDPVFVSDQTPLDALASFFDSHHYIGVPVVDEAGRLVGVVRQVAVAEAWAGTARTAITSRHRGLWAAKKSGACPCCAGRAGASPG